MFSENLSQVERDYYKNLLLSNSERFIASESSEKEYGKYLGGLVKTPLGAVRMGENQYKKFIAKHRGNLFIAARNTLERPILVFTAENGAVVYVKSFIDDSEKQKNIISVVIVKDSSSVVISTHEERMNQILNKMKKTGILYEKAPGLRDGTVQK